MKITITYQIDPQYEYAFRAMAAVDGFLYDAIGTTKNEARDKLILILRRVSENKKLSVPEPEEVEL